MKKSTLYLAVLALGLLYSCAGNSDKKDKNNANNLDSNAKSTCYVAVDGKDSAFLSIRQLRSGKVDGKLLIKYAEKPQNNGTIDGKFSADTLFADYTFTIADIKEKVYKNPLALLQKDGKLILGVGVIETSVGRSYLVKDKPINFERGRFTFEPVACKD